MPIRRAELLRLCCLLLAATLLAAGEAHATVTLQGLTPADWVKVAKWLTNSLGVSVTVATDGKLSVGDGGGAAAQRLRDMTTSATPVTIILVNNDPSVPFDKWMPDTGHATDGTQKLDIGDLEGIGNIYSSYGLTQDVLIMHAITEVFAGVALGMRYVKAHDGPASDSEIEVMTDNGTSIVGPHWYEITENGGKFFYRKIRRPDGTFVVVKFKHNDGNPKVQWYTEKVPCKFYGPNPQALILIPDPDPKVHVLTYDFANHAHTLVSPFDTVNSSPTGVAFDAVGDAYITEDLAGTDEIREFNPQGVLLRTITDPLLVSPQGIDVDIDTGDLFVAVQGRVIRMTSTGAFLGSYTVTGSTLVPTDVAVWRGGIWPDGGSGATTFQIFVTDRAASGVYRFDATSDLNAGTSRGLFGTTYLNAPEGLTVSTSDGIWVASTGNHRIVAFDSSGTVVPFNGNNYFVQDTSRAFFDVAHVDSDGLYAIDHTPGAGALLLYDFAGNVTNIYGQSALQCPTSLGIHFYTDLNNLLPFPDPSPALGVPALSTIGLALLVMSLLGLAVYHLHHRVRRSSL